MRNQYSIRCLNLLFALLIGLLLPLSGHAQSSETSRGELLGVASEIPFPDWLTTSFLEIQDDVADANDEGKHVMLFFHMNGCPYCYKMAVENFLESPHVDFIKENFSVIELNWDGSREVAFDENTSMPEKALAKQLGASATPSVIFLDASGKPIFRSDGYRDPDTFYQILQYVAGEHYLSETSFQNYAQQLSLQDDSISYKPLSDANILEASDDHLDLSALQTQPVMLLFESEKCKNCESFHEDTMKKARENGLLDDFIIARIDTTSTNTLTDFSGQIISQANFTQSQGLGEYEPSVLLINDGEIRRKIDHKLFNYHFLQGLVWVSKKHYETNPRFFDWIDTITEQRLSEGKNVNIAD